MDPAHLPAIQVHSLMDHMPMDPAHLPAIQVHSPAIQVHSPVIQVHSLMDHMPMDPAHSTDHMPFTIVENCSRIIKYIYY